MEDVRNKILINVKDLFYKQGYKKQIAKMKIEISEMLTQLGNENLS